MANVQRLHIFNELTRVVTATHFLKQLEIMSKHRDIIIEKVKDVLYMSRTVSDHQEDADFTKEEIEAINKANAEHYPEYYKPE